MDLLIREMRADDAEQVTGMVRGLARYVGSPQVPRLTADSLNRNRDLIDVTVAEQEGHVVGACLALMTFSTWRGVKGLYVVDLFVESHARGNKTGLQLLKYAAARGKARGAQFIKLEVDISNQQAARFYEKLGFVRKNQDRLFILEQEEFSSFLG